MKITINGEQRLYVIPCNYGRREGFTCLGFEYAFTKGSAVAGWLAGKGIEVSFPEWRNVGTRQGYRDFMDAVKAAKFHYQDTGERCPIELCPQLVGLEGKRVEIVDAYGDKRRFYVGKSTGWIPLHLEIANINSSGGFPVTGAPFKSVSVIEMPRRKK